MLRTDMSHRIPLHIGRHHFLQGHPSGSHCPAWPRRANLLQIVSPWSTTGSSPVANAKYGGMDVSEARKLKALEDENAKLKKLFGKCGPPPPPSAPSVRGHC